MNKYTVNISKSARKQLDKIALNIATPIFVVINKLADNPRPHGCKKLKGRDSYWVRVGDYRIIYDIYDSELVVEVVDVGHRQGVYD